MILIYYLHGYFTTGYAGNIFNVICNLHIAKCTPYNMHFAHPADNILNNSYYILYTEKYKLICWTVTLLPCHCSSMESPCFTLHNAYYTLYTAYCTLNTAYFTNYTAYWTLHTEYCILHTAPALFILQCTQQTEDSSRCTFSIAHHTKHLRLDTSNLNMHCTQQTYLCTAHYTDELLTPNSAGCLVHNSWSSISRLSPLQSI